MNIQREALHGGEVYICKDCGHMAEENFYPTNHVGTSARKLWDNDREQAIKEGIFFSDYNPCDCEGDE